MGPVYQTKRRVNNTEGNEAKYSHLIAISAILFLQRHLDSNVIGFSETLYDLLGLLNFHRFGGNFTVNE